KLQSEFLPFAAMVSGEVRVIPDNYERIIREEMDERKRQTEKTVEGLQHSKRGSASRQRLLIGTGLLPSQYNRLLDNKSGTYTRARTCHVRFQHSQLAHKQPFFDPTCFASRDS
ncbi:unnamed protein product, partial [Effrenium voratum]